MLLASNVLRYTVPPPGRSELIVCLFGRDISPTLPLAFPLHASVIVCVNPWELIFLCSHPRCLASFAITMASTSGSGGAGSSEGADKKGKAVQKRDYRKGKQHKTIQWLWRWRELSPRTAIISSPPGHHSPLL